VDIAQSMSFIDLALMGTRRPHCIPGLLIGRACLPWALYVVPNFLHSSLLLSHGWRSRSCVRHLRDVQKHVYWPTTPACQWRMRRHKQVW